MSIIVTLLICGALSGFIGGMIGIGGGIIIIPFLVYFLNVPIHTAVGTSLLVIAPTALLSGITHLKSGNVNLSYLLIILSVSLIFAVLGARISIQIPADMLRKCVAVVLLLVSLKLLIGK
ncbi:MAG: sulfite exporter TauE/SafE family protein [bacterium]|nr:sulfite exporter TauE/SafE family protein [bacterium]